MANLLELAQQAMPECEWFLDDDEDEPSCIFEDRGYCVFHGQDGVIFASLTWYGMFDLLVNHKSLHLLSENRIDLHYCPERFAFRKAVQTASDIAQFFHDAERIRDEIWGPAG